MMTFAYIILRWKSHAPLRHGFSPYHTIGPLKVFRKSKVSRKCATTRTCHTVRMTRSRGSIPLIVSSHKSTDRVLGGQLMVTVIEINNVGTKDAKFWHRLELL